MPCFADMLHHRNFHLDRKNRKSISSNSQKIKLQPKSVQRRAGTGDPSFWGEFLMALNDERNRIGHFQAQARQLTSQAFGRAMTAIKTAGLLPTVFYFPPLEQSDCGMTDKSYILKRVWRMHDKRQ
jgi:hypothetical protein